MTSRKGKRVMQDREDEASEGSDISLYSDDDSANFAGATADGSSVEKEEDADKDELAKKETGAVFRLRLLVLLVLLLAAVAVSVVVYIITRKGETDEFNTQYEGAASKIIEAFEGIAENKIGGISALAVAMIAHGKNHARKEWPFKTLSAFQERAATARSESGALFVKVCPYVQPEQLAEWENYTAVDEDGWIEEGIEYQLLQAKDHNFKLPALPEKFSDINTGWVHHYNETGHLLRDAGTGPLMPVWQTSPILKEKEVNVNLFMLDKVANWASLCFSTGSAVIGPAIVAPPGGIDHPNLDTSLLAALLSLQALKIQEYLGDPMSRVFLPVFDSFNEDRQAKAVMVATIHWASYFTSILPKNIRGLALILDNPCDGKFSYEVYGGEVKYLGRGDKHDEQFNYMERSSTLKKISSINDGTRFGLPINQGSCPWDIHVYPSQTFYEDFHSSLPIVITLAVAFVFVFAAAMFAVYDRLVERRQRLIMRKAVASSAIVSSLFPKNVRDRLMQDDQEKYVAQKHRLKSFLGGTNDNDLGLQPIADLFPDATVMFADIAGFTAWSSTREPTKVFVLLQSVYQAFDVIAKKRRVFKVETIGDSYVAVTGVPEKQANHALIMAKFAAHCNEAFQRTTRVLEIELGPGTSDLAMRFGLHSGPVTAGVLRGDRSRFQLFGDTVNTAARMESTGKRNQIQVSQATADILIAAGKSHWVKPRENMVEAKGKGVLKTYWIAPLAGKGESVTSSVSNPNDLSDTLKMGASKVTAMDVHRQDRLIDWIVELLSEFVKPIVARRGQDKKRGIRVLSLENKKLGTALDECAEVISLPSFDSKATALQADQIKSLELSAEFTTQLRLYITTIASYYHSNAFHNFEHACHVTMAVVKFIKRIETPDLVQDAEANAAASQIHDYTHGLTSDPITLVAVVFSALIHDVDHRGVSNMQLAKEDQALAEQYKNKSIAEQNSLSLSWDLLMSDGFEELRSHLFTTETELQRFRQVMVNVVLATDIFDKELNGLRKERWNKAFSVEGSDSAKRNQNKLRATIVIEHIIQASDVSHTMQHWHIYQKWNRRLFEEMSVAHQSGRMGSNPASFWYQGELGFFDNYVIPLAKKLKDCNVFGVSSDECLNYALKNRAEWEERGPAIVSQMISELSSEKQEN